MDFLFQSIQDTVTQRSIIESQYKKAVKTKAAIVRL